MKRKAVVMFRSVSWAEYLQVLIILLVIYYGYVLFVYYRKDLVALIKRRGLRVLKQPSNDNNKEENKLELMQSFCNEVTAYLTQIKSRTPAIPEIVFAVQRILQKFRLDKNIYEYAVNGFVLSECAAVCQLQLSEEDMMQVWADT